MKRFFVVIAVVCAAMFGSASEVFAEEADAKLPGGKEVKGLVAIAEVVKSGAGFQVRFSLMNVSKEPLYVNNFVGFKPLKVKWIGPDDKPRKSLHYDWLKRARLRAPSKKNFVLIQPGSRYSLAASATGKSGIRFIPKATGKHKITISYVNEQDGKKYQLKNVWTGKVTSNTVTLEVK